MACKPMSMGAVLEFLSATRATCAFNLYTTSSALKSLVRNLERKKCGMKTSYYLMKRNHQHRSQCPVKFFSVMSEYCEFLFTKTEEIYHLQSHFPMNKNLLLSKNDSSLALEV